MSAASKLFSLLEACEVQGVEPPKRTGHITVDEETLAEISGRLELPAYLSAELFDGLPVKNAFVICQWAIAKPDEDRIRALRAWKRKVSKRSVEKVAA